MKRIYQNLSGTPITSSDNLVQQHATDMLMVSHPFVGGNHPRYESNHITYETLSAQLASDLSDRYGFGTMAWVDTGEYALSGHHHEYYNKVAVSSCIKDPSEYDPACTNTIISAAVIVVDGVPHTIRAVLPNYLSIPVYTPVGTITYVGWPKEYVAAHAIDPYDDHFDGWVYCDGRQITCNMIDGDFSEARRVFGESVDGDVATFNVPFLSDFFFIDGTQTRLGHDPSQKFELVRHTHTARFKFNAQVQAQAQFNVTNYAFGEGDRDLTTYNIIKTKDEDGTVSYEWSQDLHDKNYNGTMHAYFSRTKHPNMPLEGSVRFNSGFTSVLSIGKDVDIFGDDFPDMGEKYWPNYQYMIPLVYIGKRENN